MPAIYDLVKKQVHVANERQSRYFNQGRKDSQYKIGVIVKRRLLPISSKEKKFYGPCKIVKMVSTVVYQLENLENDKVFRKHVNDIREFVTSYNPSFVG